MARTLSRLLRLLLIALVVAIVLVLVMGEMLSRPEQHLVGSPPADLAARGAQTVHLSTRSGEAVAGWFVPGRPGRGAVLLLHGVRGNRLQMVERARFLQQAGHAVLLIDLPGHGESGGSRITFGAREARGVEAALDHLRATLKGEHIGVIGVSLGGAATVLAAPRPAPDAVVLESVYPTLREAVEDRLALALGDWSRPLAPLLLMQLPLRLGITENDLRPIERLSALGSPVLVAAGSVDRHTTLTETRRLFEAARAPRELWVVDGAAHVDLHHHAPKDYEARIRAFLDPYLTSRR